MKRNEKKMGGKCNREPKEWKGEENQKGNVIGNDKKMKGKKKIETKGNNKESDEES